MKKYERSLDERTLQFAKNVRFFVRKLPRTIASIEDGKQLIRSSGSIGANYLEANESVGHKDFWFRLKICRKEAKETRYWLELLEVSEQLEKERVSLQKEADELLKIFSSILRNH